MAVDRQLFEDGLRMLWGAHHQTAQRAETDAKLATLPKLQAMVRAAARAHHAFATDVEHLLGSIGATPYRRHDAAIGGLGDISTSLASRYRSDVDRDLIIIAHAQASAHLLVAQSRTLQAYARALGYGRAARRLGHTIDAIRHAQASFDALGLHILDRRPGAPYRREPALRTTAAMHPAFTAAVVVGSILGAVALLDQSAAIQRQRLVRTAGIEPARG